MDSLAIMSGRMGVRLVCAAVLSVQLLTLTGLCTAATTTTTTSLASHTTDNVHSSVESRAVLDEDAARFWRLVSRTKRDTDAAAENNNQPKHCQITVRKVQKIRGECSKMAGRAICTSDHYMDPLTTHCG